MKDLTIRQLIKTAGPLIEKSLEPVLIAAGEHSDPLTVETIDNHVYFYSGVNSDRCLALVRQLREADSRLRSEHLSRNLPSGYEEVPIWLHIYSGGGDLFAGLAMADQIQMIKTPVYSIIEGYCASAATLISMSCTRRYIHKRALFLIHQLSDVAWGTYEQIQDEMNMLDMAMAMLVDFYASRSKQKEKEIRALLKRDSWFNAKQCLDRGFVDEIYKEPE